MSECTRDSFPPFTSTATQESGAHCNIGQRPTVTGPNRTYIGYCRCSRFRRILFPLLLNTSVSTCLEHSRNLEYRLWPISVQSHGESTAHLAKLQINSSHLCTSRFLSFVRFSSAMCFQVSTHKPYLILYLTLVNSRLLNITEPKPGGRRQTQNATKNTCPFLGSHSLLSKKAFSDIPRPPPLALPPPPTFL